MVLGNCRYRSRLCACVPIYSALRYHALSPAFGTFMQTPKSLTPKVLERVIDAGTNSLERTVLVLCYSTEALASDIAGFHVSDIRWTVEGSLSGCIVVRSDPQHTFPLDEQALIILRQYIRQSKPQCWLFEKSDGSPYKAEEILRLLNRLSERVKFRSTVASGMPPAARFLIRQNDPKVLDPIEPLPFDPVQQYTGLKTVRSVLSASLVRNCSS